MIFRRQRKRERRYRPGRPRTAVTDDNIEKMRDALQNMTCRIALNIGSIICSCVSTQKGTTLKAIIVDFLNLLNRKSYRHSLVFYLSDLVLIQNFKTWFNCMDILHSVTKKKNKTFVTHLIRCFPGP
jgi:hypothetical protein